MRRIIKNLREWCGTGVPDKKLNRIANNNGFIGIIIPIGSLIAIIIVILAFGSACLDQCTCGLASCCGSCACDACFTCKDCVVSPCLSCSQCFYCGKLHE